MRMFLVTMCDIFLLLYLTAISQQDGAPASKIKLSDYKKLENTQKELEKEVENKVTDKEKAIVDLNQERSELLEKLRLAEEKAREAERLALEALSKSELEIKKTETLTKEIQEKNDAAEKEKQIAIENQKLAEQKALQASDAEKRALEEAEKAKLIEQLALAMAAREKQNAFEKERLALLTAEKAIISEEKALQSEIKAAEAQKDAAVEKQKLNSVLQPSEKAFNKNIVSSLSEVRVEITREGIFGERGLTLGTIAAPVAFAGKTVIFQSLSDLKLDKKFDDLLKLNIIVGGKPIEAVMLHSSNNLIGLVLKQPLPSAKVLDESSLLMPTLIAVRNGTEQKFSDRIRDLNDSKLILQRDRLTKSEDGFLIYQAEGFRGTGDYGEIIMRGDQIVDLEGNLLGVATERNRISPIGKPSEWEMHYIIEDTLVNLFSEGD